MAGTVSSFTTKGPLSDCWIISGRASHVYTYGPGILFRVSPGPCKVAISLFHLPNESQILSASLWKQLIRDHELKLIIFRLTTANESSQKSLFSSILAIRGYVCGPKRSLHHYHSPIIDDPEERSRQKDCFHEWGRFRIDPWPTLVRHGTGTRVASPGSASRNQPHCISIDGNAVGLVCAGWSGAVRLHEQILS